MFYSKPAGIWMKLLGERFQNAAHPELFCKSGGKVQQGGASVYIYVFRSFSKFFFFNIASEKPPSSCPPPRSADPQTLWVYVLGVKRYLLHLCRRNHSATKRDVQSVYFLMLWLYLDLRRACMRVSCSESFASMHVFS